MHPCLYTEDIVRLICAEVSYDDYHDLVALALTAHNFCPHALDLLWWVQTSLKPLIQCFPSDLWELRNSEYTRYAESVKVTQYGSTIYLRRPIKSTDWERVNLYASRIRLLAVCEVPELDVDFLNELQLFLGEHPLLSQLRRLSWKITDDTIFPYIRLFLPPTLTAFELWPEGSPCTAELFRELGTMLPNLLDIAISSLDWPQEPEVVVRTIARETIRKWDNLRNVLLPDIDENSAVHLAQLPNLQRLRLGDVQDAMLSASPFEGMPSDGFPSLISLVVTSQKVTLATNLLRAMSNAPVENININHTLTPTTDEWAEFYQALAEHCRPDSLESVKITQEWPDISHTTPAPIEPLILRRLLSFPNVAAVILCSADGFDIDDDTLILMAASWPQLEILVLTTSDLIAPFPPRATLDSLAHFVAHCPQIYHLEYRIDARIPPRLVQKPHNRVWNETVYALHLLDSPVANPERVASFLMDLFVNLEMLCISSPFNVEEDSTWFAWRRVQKSMGDFPSLHRTYNQHAGAPILFARDHLLESYLHRWV
ncbi:hypothetical protein B0H17DRAFT_1131440 [Mycena rosella]|uniref:F-box domain-containing protein n=1 Tax=Mycena rosella TaxID=1033263 RepID=A0AAD7GMZ6_MYCRO|nr:hypothetical protein B0H17DRAFT_1131440 [Mycena rosella]